LITLVRAPSFGFAQPWYQGFYGEGSLGGGLTSTPTARYWIDKDLKFKITGVKE
jgi:hypothetical protein